MEKIFLSGIFYYSKLDTKFISLKMLDQKRLFYFLYVGKLEVCDSSAVIMFDHLTTHNLYQVYLEEPTNFITISYRAMIVGISKLAANLSIWYRQLAHLNKVVIKPLSQITLTMKISSFRNIILFCSIYIETKMIRQLHQNTQLYFTTAGFRLRANVEGGGDTYTIFQGFCYFILFVCKVTSYV